MFLPIPCLHMKHLHVNFPYWPSNAFLSPIVHLSPFSFPDSLVPSQFTVVGNLKEFSNVILVFLQDFAFFFTYFDTSEC